MEDIYEFDRELVRRIDSEPSNATHLAVELVSRNLIEPGMITSFCKAFLQLRTTEELSCWGTSPVVYPFSIAILMHRFRKLRIGPKLSIPGLNSSVQSATRRYLAPLVAEVYVRNLTKLLTWVARDPLLLTCCTRLSINFTCLNNYSKQGPMVSDSLILRFGESCLRRAGLGYMKISAWNSPDGWSALVALCANQLQYLALAGDITGETAPRLRSMASLVTKNQLNGPLSSLWWVRVANAQGGADRLNTENLTEVLAWALLPAVKQFIMCDFTEADLLCSPNLPSGSRLEGLQILQSAISVPALREILQSNPALTSLTLTYNPRYETFPSHLSHPRPTLLLETICKRSKDLQRLKIHFPYGFDADTRSATALEPAKVADGTNDANLDLKQAKYLFLGSLRELSKLETLLAPSYMLFNNRMNDSFLEIFPAGLKHLVLTDDLTQSKGIIDELISLVYAHAIFDTEYPKLATLVMPFRRTNLSLWEACVRNEVLLVTADDEDDSMKQFLRGDRYAPEVDYLVPSVLQQRLSLPVCPEAVEAVSSE